MTKTKITLAQRKALLAIAEAGEAGLDFYWYPMPRGKRVLINGNCATALEREHGLIETTYRRDESGRSIRTAHLTSAGREALNQ